MSVFVQSGLFHLFCANLLGLPTLTATEVQNGRRQHGNKVIYSSTLSSSDVPFTFTGKRSSVE